MIKTKSLLYDALNIATFGRASKIVKFALSSRSDFKQKRGNLNYYKMYNFNKR
jgi:hypothetical protein